MIVDRNILSGMGATENRAECFENSAGNILADTGNLFKAWIMSSDLTTNLANSTNKSDTINVGHDGLLDNFTLDFSFKKLGNLVAGCCISRYLFCNIVRDTSIDILGAVTGFKVNMLSTFHISSQCCVMLKTIARTILVYRQSRHILSWTLELKCVAQFTACGKTLPGIFGLHKPFSTM
ncbi:hypothetical protein TMatcc_002768 [Talaromyces marneffei ATCC 18224]